MNLIYFLVETEIWIYNSITTNKIRTSIPIGAVTVSNIQKSGVIRRLTEDLFVIYKGFQKCTVITHLSDFLKNRSNQSTPKLFILFGFLLTLVVVIIGNLFADTQKRIFLVTGALDNR